MAVDDYPPGMKRRNYPTHNGVPRICYHASEELYHRLGGKDAGLTPMNITHEGFNHWYLRWEVGEFTLYLDPTAGQFDTPVPYAEGRGRGFMTKERSAATQDILACVRARE